MKQWKSLFLAMIFVMVSFGLIACSNDEESKEETQVSEEENTSFPVTVTDDSGQEVVIEKAPERIITVIPSATEIIFALGLGDKVVGVTENDNFPEEVKDIEKVGAFELNIEKIVSLEPDLVVADVLNGEVVNQLRDNGVNVLVLGAESIDETYEDILLAGKATGTEEKAQEIVDSMKKEQQEIADIVSQIPEEERKSVWIEIGDELFTAAGGTFLNELVELAGGKNIMADQEGWPQVSEEEVLEKNPDVIFITYASYVENAVEKVKERAAWQDIQAIKEDQIFALDSDLTERAGPRITDGLRMIAEYLYPDYFKE
jgi:iron complex transport system substrate-binding protein